MLLYRRLSFRYFPIFDIIIGEDMPINFFIKKLFTTNRKLNESQAIYATNALSGLAEALIGIFIPVYIYNLSSNYQIFSGDGVINGITWAISFYIITSFITVLSILVFGKQIFEWTLKKTMFFSKIFLVASYACFSLAESNIYLIFLSAIFNGIHNTFYWIPYHIFFVKGADDGDRKYGVETGRREFLLGLSSTIGPLLGALIISQLGFPVLYGLSIVLLLLSTLPILLYVKEQSHRPHSMRDVRSSFLNNRRFLKTSVALGGSTTSYIVFTVFWSLMLYFGLRDFVEMGVITTFSGILSLALLLVIGKITDKKSKLGTHLIGVCINTGLHLTRLVFSSASFLYINGMLDNINSPLYNVPFNASIYEKSLGGSVSDFLVYREVVIHFIRLLVLLFVAAMMLLTGSWLWVFFVGAVGSALTILVNF